MATFVQGTGQVYNPSPSTPVPIHNVSGDNTIEICGKNLFNAQIMAGTYGNAVYTIGSDGLITQSDTDNSAWNINQNRVFYLSAGTYTIRIWGTRRYLQVRNLTDNSDLLVTPNDSATFTLNDRKAVAIKTYGTASGLTYPVSYYIQIEKGSTATSYEAYTGNSQLISLGDIELNKINTYQDYIYKTDKWYLHKEIGKVVLDGSESWSLLNSSSSRNVYQITIDDIENYTTYSATPNMLVDRFSVVSNSASWTPGKASRGKTAKTFVLIVEPTYTLETFKTWLGTYNTIVNYVLSTPQEIEITDTTLLEQLDNLMAIPLIKDLTHIIITPNDLTPTLDIEYLRNTSINENFVRQPQLESYYTKVETDAQIEISSNQIQSTVSELQTQVDSNGNAISSVSNQVQNLQTSTSTQINTINQTLENGVSKLTNSLVTIDINGINTSKADETFNTQITNKTFEVRDGETPLVFVGYDTDEQRTVARIDTLESKRATIGVHRTEVITRNGVKRTAGFYVGGGN